MQNKTQVFPLPGSIFVHNRLTHSLEVASVGMSLGNDVVRALKRVRPELAGTLFEELGTKDEYNALTEGHPYKNNVAAFIRVINGIDHKKALQIYQQFVDGYDLTSEQEQYLKNILDYVSMNGDIETKNFMEYPLKQYNWRAIFGDHFVNLKDFIKQIHGVISA